MTADDESALLKIDIHGEEVDLHFDPRFNNIRTWPKKSYSPGVVMNTTGFNDEDYCA